LPRILERFLTRFSEAHVARPLFLLKLLIRSGLARYLPGLARLADGGTDFLHYYSDRVLGSSRGDIDEATAFFEQPPPDVVDLSCGVPRVEGISLNPPRPSSDRRAWPSPWGLPQVRNAVAEKLLADQQLAVSPNDEVLITSGAAGALHTILDAFVNRKDRVVLLDPTSPLFALSMKTHGARVRWLYSWSEEGRTRFSFDELARALRGARLLVLASPGNPGGGMIAADDLEQLTWWAEKHDVLIVNDESFAPFRYEGEWTSVGALPRARKRTLTIGTVSKSHGLASLRVGWLAGHRHLVRACQVSAALRMTTVSTLCQQVAETALRQSAESFAPLVSEMAARRRYAYERLQALGLTPNWPVGGFFFWLPVWEMGFCGRKFAEKLLEQKRVQVTPGDLFGPSGMGHVRISFAADDGRLREGLGRIAEFVGAVLGQNATDKKKAA
jgi:aspartate/methionine/tyrosine aminotransferase